MSSRKSKWEYAVLVSIIVMMAGGLVWTIVALLTAPKVADPFADAEPGERVRVVRENPRVYHKDMNVHTLSASEALLDKYEEGDDEEHEKLIPMIPDTFSPAAAPLHFDPAIDGLITRNRARVNARSEEDDLLADDDDKEESTGWGWLADDIAKKRSEKEEAEVEREEKEANEEWMMGNAEEEDSRDRKERGEPVYFTDTLFSTDSTSTDPYAPNIYRDDEYEEAGDEEASRVAAVEEAEAEAAEAAEDMGASWDDARDVLTIRDPFSSGSTEAEGISEGSWGMGREGENFSGMGYTGDRFDGDADRSGVGRESSRIIEAAEYRGDSQYGFASDAMFRSGGGYTPSGVDAFQSDTRFSGTGLFGGNPAEAISPSINAGGSLSQPGSSVLSTPSSSSSLRSGGDAGLATPKTLPW